LTTISDCNPCHSSLIKEESNRPKYSKLLLHPFIEIGEKSHIDVAAYVSQILESMANNGITQFTMNQPAECWTD
jgi:mitogen-activated protein kinase kinase 4